MIHHGDLFDVLPTLDAESIDACVTDPPYGLEFMGKEWDRLTGYFAGPDNFKGLNLPRQRKRNVRCPECGKLAYDHKPCQCGGIGRQRSNEMQDWHCRWAREVFRVLKPGAHLIAFGGTRTFHRLTCAIEDAGFEIRDCLSYLYGSGFPKSLNIGCKCRGNPVSYSHAQQTPERSVRPLLDADVPEAVNADDESGQVLFTGLSQSGTPSHGQANSAGVNEGREQSGMEGRELHRAGEGLPDDPNAGASSSASERIRAGARRYRGKDTGKAAETERGSASSGPRSSEQSTGEPADLRLPPRTLDDRASSGRSICKTCGGIITAKGQGTALKPGWEPIILARKPTVGTVKANVERYGTAALNIDACRIGDVVETWPVSRSYAPGQMQPGHRGETQSTGDAPSGRWPANVLLDEEAAAMLDEQTGDLVSGGTPEFRNSDKFRNTYGAFRGGESENGIGRSIGGGSRFYYVAKPSREERDFGCDRLTARSGGDATDRKDGSAGLNNPRAGAGRTGGSRNVHPTVKPVELMRWLVKLVTPPGGIVLDPFMGSGTTGMACRYEHRRFIGIEREADYIQIAEARIAAVAPLFGEASA